MCSSPKIVQVPSNLVPVVRGAQSFRHRLRQRRPAAQRVKVDAAFAGKAGSACRGSISVVDKVHELRGTGLRLGPRMSPSAGLGHLLHSPHLPPGKGKLPPLRRCSSGGMIQLPLISALVVRGRKRSGTIRRGSKNSARSDETSHFGPSPNEALQRAGLP